MRSVVVRFVRAVRTNALLGVLFALPAVGLSSVLFPDGVGYLVISTTVMVLFVSAKRINTSDRSRLDTEELSERAQVRLLGLLLVSTAMAVTAQLLAVVALAELSTVLFGPTLLPIGIAVLFPVVDRQVGGVHSLLSVGGITAWLVFQVAGWYYSRDTTTRDSGLSLSADEKVLY